jgi:choice-of-anchor B domain-containing protein
MKKLFFIATLLMVATSQLYAQYNFQFLGKKTYTAQNLSGSWGYNDTINNKEYALVGTTKGLSIVDITTPTNPVEVKFINGKQGTWRECQTYKNFAYITQDNNTGADTVSEGVLIYNLSQLPGGKADTFKGTNPANDYILKTHSLFIDEKGFLYLNGGDAKVNGVRTNGVMIYDLKPNPMKPTFVGFTQNLFGTGAVNYVHDCYVRNDTMFQAHIYNNRFTVWDIRNRANPIKIQDFATPYSTIHNMWLSDNSKTLFVTHEQFNMPMEAYDISDLSNIRQINEFKINPTNEEIAHNVHVINDFVYASYYSDGVAVFDVSDPTNVVTVGYYDTQPTTTRAYSGVWGAYGYYKSGNMTLSDMTKGLFVIKPTYIRAARIQGVVTDTNTTQELTGVKISFVDTANSVLTTIDGIYKTGTVKAGFTRFKAEKTGYITKFFNATLINGTTLTVDIQLRQIPVYTTQNASFCQGSTFRLPDGRLVSDPGTYISDIVLPTGRDSIITTNLTQKNRSIRTVNASFCEGTSYTLPNGSIVTNAATYTNTFSNSVGCDSIITTILTQKNKTSATVNASFCEGTSYTLPGGSVVTTAATYTNILTNSNGCDSTITTILIRKNKTSRTINASFCDGTSYTLPGGSVVTDAATYTDILTNSNGCDSTVTTILIRKNKTSRTINASFCEGTSYTLPSGRVVTDAATYTDILTNSNGCDSTVTTILTQKNKTARTVNASFCEGTSYTLPSGRVVTDAATYTDILTNSNGCDSTITTILTQKNKTSRTINASFCEGTSYTLPGGGTVTTAATYTNTLTNSNGCDSTITTILSRLPSYSINLEDSIYRGEIYTLPSGVTTSTSGIYVSELQTLSGCDSIITTDLKVVDTTTLTGIRNSISEIPIKFILNEYQLTIQNKSTLLVSELEIYNSIGSLVSKYTNPSNTILLPELPKDIYIIRTIMSNQEQVVGKLIIY